MALERTELFRLETLDEPDETLAPAMQAFFRRLGVAHVYREAVRPTLQNGSSLVTIAVRDRPWPPWGIGAQAVSALAFFHPVSGGHAGLGNVFVVDEEQTSIGLIAAVYKEALNQLARRGVHHVHFVVREEAALSMHVLGTAGFQQTSHPFLTEQARYRLYETELEVHITALGLQDSSPLELLADQFKGAAFDRIALFLITLNLSFLPYWQVACGLRRLFPTQVSLSLRSVFLLAVRLRPDQHDIYRRHLASKLLQGLRLAFLLFTVYRQILSRGPRGSRSRPRRE